MNSTILHRVSISTFLLLTALLSDGICQTDHGPLRVSENQRFLVHADGTPFFWLADTAWELFHRCSRSEALHYLQKRKQQGFNVIQAVALAEIDGLHMPNVYGEKPLHNDDPHTPNEKYFEHVDFIFQKADSLGMYIALLPTWGDKLFKNSWGEGPEVLTVENARPLGQWLGSRYRDQRNIIWVIGGDRNPRPGTEDVEVWRAMARGVEAGVGDPDQALMTFHPQPTKLGGSSTWFHDDDWLDFNMHQTGHCANRGTYQLIQHDYHLSPTKPVLDGEPIYEDHPNCFNAKELGYSLPRDIRRTMYWNVFAGGFGQTYGCHAVWQMYTTDREGINGPLRPWPVALDLPAANQVQHLKHLMLSRPFLSRIPDLDMVLNNPDSSMADQAIATRDREGKYAMVYFPEGGTRKISLEHLVGSTIKSWWFDPRTGISYPDAEILRKDHQEFTAPSAGKGSDWVLVLDGEGMNFAPPAAH